MQKKSTFQPWSKRENKAPGVSKKNNRRGRPAMSDTRSEEVGLGGGDSNSYVAKVSSKKTKKKAVKLSAAAVDVLAGIPRPGGGQRQVRRIN